MKRLLTMACLVLVVAASGRAADRLNQQPRAFPDDSFIALTSVRLDPRLAAARQAKLDRATAHPKLVQRLESRLIDAVEQAAVSGEQQSIEALRKSGHRLQGENVIVVAECDRAANPRDVAALIAAKNGTIIRIGKSHVKAAVPLTALEEMAGTMPGISFVRTPIEHTAENTIITEGRGTMLANPWHAAGYLGQGVKIAVIDGAFAGLATRKAEGEIPASAIETNFSVEGMTAGTSGHGCACAEIIYDMAPNCQLYLIKVLDNSDSEAAESYCEAQGIQIISFSAGYKNVNFYDGTAPSSITPHPVNIVNDATSNGMLFIKSAGNDQEKHSMSDWQDANTDRYLDWQPTGGTTAINELWNGGNVIPVNTVIEVSLTWNRWPVTDQDFDIHLYRLSGTSWTYVTSAATDQTGTQPPRERLVYTVTTAARYGVAVYKWNATASPTFILRTVPYRPVFYGYNNFSTPVPGSLTCPGDAAACFTVGAIDYADYTTGPVEYFSSLGPNNGAYTGNPTVVKPDICGPDRIITATFGPGGFAGTSAAAPHMAGLAALIKSAYPAYDNLQLRNYIEAQGVDLGSAGKDNTYGSGAACLPSPPVVNQPPVITEGASVSVTMSEDGSPTAFSLTLNAADPDGATLTWSVPTLAGSGAASASGTGASKAIGYTPAANWSGADSFVVRVSDGTLADDITVNVTVQPVNDRPTDVALSNSTVAENQPSNTTVGVLSTTDPDAANTFTYTLVAGAGSTDNASFSIGGSNLRTAAWFNYEIQSNYSVRVQSADQGGLSTQKVFAVAVHNVNEPSPAFLSVIVSNGSNVLLKWSSVTNHHYTVSFSTNLKSGFSVLRSNITATPVVNSYTDSVQGLPPKFWQLTTEP